MEYEEIVDSIRQRLSAARFQHSLGVSQAAAQLAKKFNGDLTKAKLAGILHDCAREFSSEQLLAETVQQGIAVNAIERNQPVLLHAKVGAKLASRCYQINDAEILEAIEKHTVGGTSLSTLAKIIYLADFIEPGRDFPGVDKLRKIAETNLDEAVLAAYDHTIKYIIAKRGLLHQDTIEGRNELLVRRFVISKD